LATDWEENPKTGKRQLKPNTVPQHVKTDSMGQVIIRSEVPLGRGCRKRANTSVVERPPPKKKISEEVNLPTGAYIILKYSST